MNVHPIHHDQIIPFSGRRDRGIIGNEERYTELAKMRIP
jgi:hypothetical protein